MIVWLDYSRWVIMRRIIRRSLIRTLTRETLWGTNNRETWRKLLSRDSLIAWVWTTYASSKQRYTELLVQPEYQHLKIVHLRTPREAEQWLKHG
jgi:hypothetical protein